MTAGIADEAGQGQLVEADERGAQDTAGCLAPGTGPVATQPPRSSRRALVQAHVVELGLNACVVEVHAGDPAVLIDVPDTNVADVSVLLVEPVVGVPIARVLVALLGLEQRKRDLPRQSHADRWRIERVGVDLKLSALLPEAKVE